MIIKRQHCQNCIFSSWFNNFQSVSYKSIVIKLPEDFIKYLGTDGIVLPDSEEIKYSNDLSDYSDDDEDWEQERNSNNDLPVFPQLKEKIDKAIEELGGTCFIKLNWSAPKDANWITRDTTLKCSSFNDICLLLKSSDFISHDLTKPYEYCDNASPHPNDQYELVLRKYIDFVPGMEFRCFVKSNQIIGISQRYYQSFYEYLQSNLNILKAEIIDFYNRKVKGKFADTSFVMDIYKDKYDTWKLVDFNPFGPVTDSLLFTWEELENTDVNTPSSEIFRVTSDTDGIQPSATLFHGLPKDAIDLSCGEDIKKMIDFFNVSELISKPGEKNDSE